MILVHAIDFRGKKACHFSRDRPAHDFEMVFHELLRH